MVFVLTSSNDVVCAASDVDRSRFVHHTLTAVSLLDVRVPLYFTPVAGTGCRKSNVMTKVIYINL